MNVRCSWRPAVAPPDHTPTSGASECSRSDDSVADRLEVGDVFLDASGGCLARAREVFVVPVAAKPEGRRSGCSRRPRTNGRDLDDPPAADQQLELAAPDRAPDSPVLTSRHCCYFLDGQVRTVHDHIYRSIGPGTSYGWANTKSANYAKGRSTYLRVRTERGERRSAGRVAVGWRVLEPPDQVLELAGNAPGLAHGLTKPSASSAVRRR